MEPKNRKLYTAKLISRREIAHGTPELTFRLDDPAFTFISGQYIWLTVPALAYPDTRGNRRAFSICSARSKLPEISIVYRSGVSGYKKTLNGLAVGSELGVFGPSGSFSPYIVNGAETPGSQKPLVFVAGGVAIAPFMSILEDAAGRKLKPAATIITANPTIEQSVYHSRLNELCRENPEFKLVEIAGKLDWQTISGAVANPSENEWYIAGPQLMVDAVTALLLEHGVGPDKLYFDEFYGYPPADKSIRLASDIIKKVVEVNIFRLAVQNSFQHIIITDVNGLIIYANPAAEAITGFKLEEMLGETPRLWGGMMDSAFYKNVWKTIKVERKPIEVTVTNRRKNNEIYRAIARISPIIDENGDLIGFVGTEEDISGRDKAEASLRESERYYRSLFETMSEGLAYCRIIYDTNGKPDDYAYINVNKAFTKITGLTGVIGKKVTDVMPEIKKTNPELLQIYGRVAQTGKPEKFETYVKPLGVWLAISAYCPQEGYFIAVFENITEQKNNLETIKKEKSKDEAILAAIGDGVVVVDNEGKILLLNDSAQKMLNLASAEVLGKDYHNFWELETPDGQEIADWQRPIDLVLKTGQLVKSDKFIYASKSRKFPVAVTAAPVMLDNRMVGAVVVFRDVTREHEIDREKTEFMSIAAHQLRTPLGTMRWNLEMLRDGDMGEIAPKVSETLNEVYESDLRLIRLVNDLLDVTRIEQRRKMGKDVLIDAAEIIKKVIAAEKPLVEKKNLQLNFTAPETSLAPIMVDPEHFFQTIDNLVVNAIKYTYEGKGIINVSLAEKDGSLFITIADNGIGIRPVDKNLIFSKLFRADNAVKMEASGTGLGLFVAKSFTEGWGGKITFTSEINKGAVFVVEIPVEKVKSQTAKGKS